MYMDNFGGGGGSSGQTEIIIVVAICCCSSVAIGIFLFYAYKNQEKFTWLDFLWKLFKKKDEDPNAGLGSGTGTDAGLGLEGSGSPITDSPITGSPIVDTGTGDGTGAGTGDGGASNGTGTGTGDGGAGTEEGAEPPPSPPNSPPSGTKPKCKKEALGGTKKKPKCASAAACQSQCIPVGKKKYAKSVKQKKCWVWVKGYTDKTCKKKKSGFMAFNPEFAPPSYVPMILSTTLAPQEL